MSLPDLAACSPRAADLLLLEQRVRAGLPVGSLSPPDLVLAAKRRVGLAGRLLGAVEFASLPYVAPVWQDSVSVLAEHTRVFWSGPAPPGSEKLPGERVAACAGFLPAPEVVACADARSEALEALRWVRELISSGRAMPRDIALAAADPKPWDAALLAARAEACLPLHFSHGIPALETRGGQACASLANLLQHGLSQQRVRRVLAHCASDAPGFSRLPKNALFGIARGAALSEVEHWRAAFAAALPGRLDRQDPWPILLPLLDAAASGLDVAEDAGRLFLPPAAQGLWTEALRQAPSQALPITLDGLHVADARNPGDSVTWGPARHLACSPRKFVRLLGLNAKAWPRQASDDPILPAHILDLSRCGMPGVAAQDRAAFEAIRAGAGGALVLSRTRRNGRGGSLSPSALLPAEIQERILKRQRVPGHASSPADRLLARPEEAGADECIAAAVACAAARRSWAANAHDGLLPVSHPLILQALGQTQSATSLRLLLRDPQGFVWARVLHWSSPPSQAAGQLTMDPRAHGELVHEILRGAVESLERGSGFCGATVVQARAAIDTAASGVLHSWPSHRPTPPRLLWAYAVDAAAEQAMRALGRDMPLQPSTRSYTEVGFGDLDTEVSRSGERPWSSRLPVPVPGTDLVFGGSIDRLDIRADGAVQVTDYKTGKVPKKHGTMVLDGGRELQRVLYALAARTLLPEVRSTRARLAFLQSDPADLAVLHNVEDAIASTSSHLRAAAKSLLEGVSLPGPDTEDEWSARLLALPAAGSGYSNLKRAAFSKAFHHLRQAWLAR